MDTHFDSHVAYGNRCTAKEVRANLRALFLGNRGGPNDLYEHRESDYNWQQSESLHFHL